MNYITIFTMSVVSIVMVFAIIIFIAIKLHQINKHQAKVAESAEVMQTFLHSLNTRSAVNDHEHRDFSSRVADIARQNAAQDEDIRQLRTQGHLHSNTLLRVDPLFKPYRTKTESGSGSTVTS